MPAHARWLGAGRTLSDALRDGTIDAIVGGFPPAVFHAGSPWLRRLYRDHREAEERYFRTTSLYPVLHLIGVDRRVHERNPQVLARLQAAVTASRAAWFEQARQWGGAAPWALNAFEEVATVLGPDWQEYGLASRANRAAVEAFSRAQLKQGYVSAALTADQIFAEYLRSAP